MLAAVQCSADKHTPMNGKPSFIAAKAVEPSTMLTAFVVRTMRQRVLPVVLGRDVPHQPHFFCRAKVWVAPSLGFRSLCKLCSMLSLRHCRRKCPRLKLFSADSQCGEPKCTHTPMRATEGRQGRQGRKWTKLLACAWLGPVVSSIACYSSSRRFEKTMQRSRFAEAPGTFREHADHAAGQHPFVTPQNPWLSTASCWFSACPQTAL